MGAALTVVGAAVVLVAGVASSVLGTQAHQYSSPAALALISAAGSFFGVFMVAGLSSSRSGGIREWLPQVLAGAGGFALAPWLVMVNRYTDAPPGSEVVFFSVASWGAMLAVAVALTSCERISRMGGALLALAGAAAVVANWERPSSFSPFVRYAREESFMLVAGALWVVLMLVLLAASRRKALSAAALRAGLGGIGAALVLAGFALADGSMSRADFGGTGVTAFGIAVAFSTAGALVVLRSRSAVGIAGAYLLVPATMSLMLQLQEVFGARGPNPLLVVPILGAAVSTMAGLWVTRERPADAGARETRAVSTRQWVARGLAGVALASATVALALPGMTATVKGFRTDGSQFRAAFGLYGFEVAGTWLALGVAVVALGIAVEGPQLRSVRSRAVAIVAALAAWPFVAATPLRTLTSFIPSDVQVDYGSEFARIDFAGGPPMLAAIALGGALLAVGVTLSHRIPGPRAGSDDGSEDDREVDSR